MGPPSHHGLGESYGPSMTTIGYMEAVSTNAHISHSRIGNYACRIARDKDARHNPVSPDTNGDKEIHHGSTNDA